RSLLLAKPTYALDHGGGKKLEVDSHEFKILADWIAGGAPRPRSDDPLVTRLEVFPPESVLGLKGRTQVLVRALHSDGSARDVTPWSRFSSSEDLVATVNEDGLASVTGHGEAAVSVLYSNQVAAARIVSPFSNRVTAEVFKKSPRNNFIDDLVRK